MDQFIPGGKSKVERIKLSNTIKIINMQIFKIKKVIQIDYDNRTNIIYISYFENYERVPNNLH